MKIKSDYILKTVAGCHTIVPTGQASLNFNKIMSLNDVGVFLFEKLQKKDMSEDELVEELVREYSIDIDTATKDIKSFISNLKNQGLIE